MSTNKIPAGVFRATALPESLQEGLTKTGTEQIVLKLYLEDLGETVTTFLYFSEKAAQYSVPKLKATGWDGSANYNGVGSKECEVEIKYEMYDGKEQMRVDIKDGGGGITLDRPLQGTQKDAFRAKLAAMAKASAPAGAAPAGRSGFKLPGAS